MKLFGFLCIVCMVAATSAQKAESWASSDCSGDPASESVIGECNEQDSKWVISTMDECKKDMEVSTQQYSDKDCTTKDGEPTKSKWANDVDKCIDMSSSVTINNVTSTNKMSMKVTCSPASAKTFMPIMTAFVIIATMFSQ